MSWGVQPGLPAVRDTRDLGASQAGDILCLCAVFISHFHSLFIGACCICDVTIQQLEPLKVLFSRTPAGFLFHRMGTAFWEVEHLAWESVLSLCGDCI